jgi:predicted nucleic acid-binding Zn ribbon protein
MEKNCPECGEKIIGRIDKIFCSDQCRNTYNNRQNRASTNLIRKINSKLQKNRRILAKLAPEGKTTVHKDILLKEGFDLNYFTNIYRTKAGTTYYYCYEMGYLPLENNFYVVVRKQY